MREKPSNPKRCPRFGVDLCVPAANGHASCATCEHDTRTGPAAREARTEALRIWRDFLRGRECRATKKEQTNE